MIGEAEKERFRLIASDIEKSGRGRAGIGTLREKTLHRILKTYFCPDETRHETKIGSFVADAAVGKEIFEIQCGGLFPLKKKIAYYLSDTDMFVNVVCPVIAKKRLIRVDPLTGELGKARGVYAGHGILRVLPELVYLMNVLDFSRVKLWIVELDIDEYRVTPDGEKGKKKGASRFERLPRELLDLREISSAKDIGKVFLPPDLPERFSSAELGRILNLKRRSLSAAVKVLLCFGVIEIAEKKGRSILYRSVDDKF